MKVYYAHFMGIYNTPQEQRDIDTLTKLGFEIVNPNSPGISEKFNKRKDELKDVNEGYLIAFDEVFFQLVKECGVFAFRGLPDGRIPGGVGIELKEAQKCNKIIIELPCGTQSRIMNGEQTREYLRDIGQR